MVAGPLKRPDEIGFKEGFDLIEFLLVFKSLYPLAQQLTRALRLKFVGCAT
jgi:hypothetical protein